LAAWVQPAAALPSFTIQTAQPCAACHVGAFGPQLTRFGRDFKLFGYVAAAPRKSGILPVALGDQMTFTHTQKDQPPGAVFPPRFSTNDNFTPAQEASVYYAGALIPKQVGAFVEGHYEAADGTISLSNLDIRHAQEARLAAGSLLWGATFNNSPSVQDIWNSTPAWGFPYFSSAVAPTPAAGSLLDQTNHTAYGLGLYGMYDDLAFAEFDLYKQPAKGTLQVLGQPIADIDVAEGVVPYWRAALQYQFDHERQDFHLGTFGLAEDIRPGGDSTTGKTDHYLDVAFDASDQWYANPNDVRATLLSAHATYIHETQRLDASRLLSGSNSRDHLDAVRADVSLALDATFTPTIQYFRKWGSRDFSGHWGTDVAGNPVVNPDSAGWVAELAYVPWGKPDSLFDSMNGRVLLQYTYYTKFNGAPSHASDNNTLMIMVHIVYGLNY
jgi:hypothetical protein